MSSLPVSLILCLAIAGAGYCFVERSFLHHEPKIVNGLPAKVGEFPYMVYLELGRKFMCGGSIYNQNTILTAAHCLLDKFTGQIKPSIVEKGIYAFVGTRNITSPSIRLASALYGLSELPGNIFKVATYDHHPDYIYASTSGNDIAILKLEKPITYYPGLVEAIPLATTDELQEAKKAIVTGWGDIFYEKEGSEILLKVELDVLEATECDGPPPKTICAGRSGKDACNGDSGGPLVIQTGYCSKQIGIVSYSRGACAEMPSVYTDATRFANWIEEKAGKGDGKCF